MQAFLERLRALYPTRISILTAEPVEKPPPDPWTGSDGTYISRYRRYLEEVCEALAARECDAHYAGTVDFECRFLPDEKCVEVLEVIHDRVSSRVALVKVHGSECSAYEAVVIGALRSAEKAIFERFIPLKVRFRNSLI